MAKTSAKVILSHLAGSDDILKECSEIEVELEELKAAYEQYFLGMERLPPARAHQALKRRFGQLRSTFNRTTSVRFRVQSLTSKFLTYERLWHRTMEEIENGTYKRDLFKARLHAAKRQSAGAARTDALAPSAAASGPVASAPGASPGRPASQPSPTASELSEARLRAVYDAYVQAKKRCGEDVSKISFESVASKLRKQVPGILEKHKVSSVEFKVAIKDGKAVLRAVPAAARRDGDES